REPCEGRDRRVLHLRRARPMIGKRAPAVIGENARYRQHARCTPIATLRERRHARNVFDKEGAPRARERSLPARAATGIAIEAADLRAANHVALRTIFRRSTLVARCLTEIRILSAAASAEAVGRAGAEARCAAVAIGDARRGHAEADGISALADL